MGNWPIVKSQRTMPGTSTGVRANLSFDTGEAEVWEQIGKMALTGVDIVSKYYAQQAEIQLVDSKNRAEGEMLNLADRLRQNPDEDTYHKELAASIKTMQTFRPKNGMAARGYDSWINNQTPAWRSDVEKSRQIRLDNKWHAETDILIEKAEDTGSTALLKLHIASGLALGRIDENTAGDILRETNKKVQFRQAKTLANNNPEYVLELLKSGELEKQFPVYKDPDLKEDIRSQSEGKINYNEREKNRRISELYKLTYTHAMNKDMTAEKFEILVRNTEGLTDKQKTNIMNTYYGAANIWKKEGYDPFTKTRNPFAYMQLRKDIAEGKPITEAGIWEFMMSEPDNGPIMSIADAEKAIRALPGSGQDVELKTPFAKLTHDYIESLYATEEYTIEVGGKDVKRKRIPFDKYGLYQSKLDEVNAIIKAYPNNPVRAQKEIEESLVGLRRDNAKKWLSDWKSFVPEKSFPFGMRTAFGLGGYYNIYKAAKYGISLIPQTQIEKEFAEMTDEELEAIAGK